MRVYDIIKKKRDGFDLSDEEINFIIGGYVRGEVPDYQISAFLMAVYFKGMNHRETLTLTQVIADSGEKLDLHEIEGFKVDKHSSGGVGDKTTLVVAPIVASLGVKVAKMSGRGLGHTGGTIDKLESIPNFRTDLTREEIVDYVNKIGIALAGQSGQITPADKKLYALRDVTATVDCEPLIASSIMGKKLASADDGIVLDVKVGSGSFNKTPAIAYSLAELMVSIGKGAGKKTIAAITDMDRPLGREVGNGLEVIEAIDTLQGKGEERFLELCINLSALMLNIAGKGSISECKVMVQNQIENGEGFAKFRQMVMMQGGDVRYIDNPSLLDSGERYEVKADREGYIYSVNTEQYGIAALILGAGRNRKEDTIDMSAGITILRNKGDYVKVGECVAILHSKDKSKFEESERILLGSLTITPTPPKATPVILDIVD